MRGFKYYKNRRCIKIMREYINLIEKKHLIPKEAYRVIKRKYGICRKTIYNYVNKFKDIPLRSL